MTNATEGEALDWIVASTSESEDVVEKEPVSGDIVLEGSLGMVEAETMHHKLSAILQANIDVTIQSEALSRVDSAGTQLLYAFVREAGQLAISIKWVSVSDELRESAVRLGLSEGMRFDSA